jgi:broad specificity phosphatase PhoE
LLAISLPGFAASSVIFVRHAEKAGAMTAGKMGKAAGSKSKDDPPLTPAGQQRALALARTLADVPVRVIFVTNTKRSQQTAKPLADRLKLQPQVVDESAALAIAIKKQDGVVVVVGHSNTIPDVIALLGGPRFEIKDPEYDNLFVLSFSGATPTLLRLHYGAPAPATAKVP